MNQYIVTEEELGVIERDDFFKFFQDKPPWERRKCFTALIRSHPHQSEREMLEQKYSQLMAASINNEHPGWVQIADIGDILRPSDAVIPDIENLQEFPFRSYPKRKLRQKAGEQG
jgi:hypothetical protein